jgi:hypothetical protein
VPWLTLKPPAVLPTRPLPPLDPEKLKETDDLIATGDAIIAKMNALISTLDLHKIKLSKTEQAQLDAQRH